jgi:hypothetical protein
MLIGALAAIPVSGGAYRARLVVFGQWSIEVNGAILAEIGERK